jgi:hypothetical protein
MPWLNPVFKEYFSKVFHENKYNPFSENFPEILHRHFGLFLENRVVFKIYLSQCLDKREKRWYIIIRENKKTNNIQK